MHTTLGLFPLNTVLVPGAALRLHVFEDRYRQLMSECIARGLPFGVCLDRNGRETGTDLDPSSVGTTAVIEQVKRLPEGRLYISAHGVQRFRIEHLDHSKPYLSAAVALLGEPLGPSQRVSRLQASAQHRFKEYLQALLGVGAGELDDLTLPEDPAASSYVIADALQVGLAAKQRLLEARDATERLRTELQLLLAETQRLRALRTRVAARERSGAPAFGVRFSLN